MQKIETRNMLLELDESTLGVAVKTEHIVWSWSKEFRPRMICEEGEYFFADAEQISHEYYDKWICRGILT